MKIQSAFNVICIFFSCSLDTMAINVFNWRITTNRVHLFSSLASFSLIASFCVFLRKIHESSRNFLNFIYIYIYIYIYKIEIRNSKTYLPEGSVSSTMDSTRSPTCWAPSSQHWARYRSIEWRVFECFMMFHHVLSVSWCFTSGSWFLLVVHDVSQCITCVSWCFAMFNNVLCLVSRATISVAASATASGISDNAAGIGDNTAGIIDIATGRKPDPMLNSVLTGVTQVWKKYSYLHD